MCGVGRLPQYAILELQKLSTIRRFIAFRTPESNGGQVISITVRFKKFLNAFFNPGSYFETKSPHRVTSGHAGVGIPAFRKPYFDFPVSFVTLPQSAVQKLLVSADFLPLKCGTVGNGYEAGQPPFPVCV